MMLHGGLLETREETQIIPLWNNFSPALGEHGDLHGVGRKIPDLVSGHILCKPLWFFELPLPKSATVVKVSY